ncbi:MAG: minor capsid protein [Ignavibacteriae bacterium]|nr:minor capsid protein [Ignavibacteriota bacterium]
MPPAADLLQVAFRLPPEKAVEFLRAKGYAVGYDWRDVWQESQARAFTVAKAMNLDVLEGIRQMVDRAVSDGISLDKFQRSLEPFLKLAGWWGRSWPRNDQGQLVDEHGVPFPTDASGAQITPADKRPPLLGAPHRLRTIYRMNMQSALNAGRYRRMVEVAEQRPYWQYNNPGDERTTTICAGINGRVYRYDDPIWSVMYPPNHWNCRSRVSSLSARELKRDNLEVSTSEGALGESEVLVSERTGELRTVATLKIGDEVYSTGPGFSYNPGSVDWQPDLRGKDSRLAAAFVTDVANSVVFNRLLEGKGSGNVTAAIMSKALQKAIGVQTNSVLLSSETVAEQAVKHPEMTPDDYRALPVIIGDPDVVIRERADTLIFTRSGEVWYHAVARGTKDGSAVYLRSFRKTDAQDVARVRKRGTVVFERQEE